MALVLLACYDRKVQREFFAEMLDATTEVTMLLAKMETAASLLGAMRLLKPEIPTPEIEQQIEGFTRAWQEKREHIGSKFSLVQQIPTCLDIIS